MLSRLGLLRRVQIAVESREVAARNLQTQGVALEKDIAGGPQIDGELVHLTGLQQVGLFSRIAIAGADDSVCEIATNLAVKSVSRAEDFT